MSRSRTRAQSPGKVVREAKALGLFSSFGVELEYMIVSKKDLSVLPLADELLRNHVGMPVTEIDFGDMAWSNEFVLHVIEIKNQSPNKFDGLAAKFQDEVSRINEILKFHNACLMPTGMHPWMNPQKETRLWPHDSAKIYQTYDRIFNCRNHGWANIQSNQIHMPFSNTQEFGKLHAAIRYLIPLLPALGSSSPLQEGVVTAFLSNRLEAYRTNSENIPSITGRVIPEAIYQPNAYRKAVLKRIYDDLAPYDPDGIIREDWVNARGAIPRFDLGSIEIRVLDMQEYPAADIAIHRAVTAVLKALVSGKLLSGKSQRTWAPETLQDIFRKTVLAADETVIDNKAYLEGFGLKGSSRRSGEIWFHLIEKFMPRSSREERESLEIIKKILHRGVLSRRIVRALGRDPSRKRMELVYGELCECLEEGHLFRMSS